MNNTATRLKRNLRFIPLWAKLYARGPMDVCTAQSLCSELKNRIKKHTIGAKDENSFRAAAIAMQLSNYGENLARFCNQAARDIFALLKREAPWNKLQTFFKKGISLDSLKELLKSGNPGLKVEENPGIQKVLTGEEEKELAALVVHRSLVQSIIDLRTNAYMEVYARANPKRYGSEFDPTMSLKDVMGCLELANPTRMVDDTRLMDIAKIVRRDSDYLIDNRDPVRAALYLDPGQWYFKHLIQSAPNLTPAQIQEATRYAKLPLAYFDEQRQQGVDFPELQELLKHNDGEFEKVYPSINIYHELFRGHFLLRAADMDLE